MEIGTEIKFQLRHYILEILVIVFCIFPAAFVSISGTVEGGGEGNP